MTTKNTSAQQTLGTLLRHLAENLDLAVEQAYARSGLDYRPRYTPVFRALLDLGPSSIQAIAFQAGITHSAASQTVAEMAKRGWVQLGKGADARQHIVTLTRQAEEAIPVLQRHWAVTMSAANSLDRELSVPLTDLLREAIEALERTSFIERIERANSELKVIL
ncbi:MAG TPA: helix-turn-helix domain-containing protein [Chthonomonadaceae bacterium]|nr:helix-turn-helix domain-containing protein [Chthonomonadaceae bacterium]